MLDCRAPRSPVLNCYFEVVNTKSTMVLSCLTTVTGQELLRRSQQVPPAVVQVECFYTVKYGDLHSPSPHSIISSITVEGESLGGPFDTSAEWTYFGYCFFGKIQKNTQTLLLHFGKLQVTRRRQHCLSLPRLELQHQVSRHTLATEFMD